MKLYPRDYNQLLPDEMAEFHEFADDRWGKSGSIYIKPNRFAQCSKAVRHYMQLFPNNYLDILELKDVDKLNPIVEKFQRLLEERNCSERDIIEFVKTNGAFFLIGSILGNYQFGHHAAHVFPEFPLGNSYVVDYLIVGKNSGGYEFVFVEMEHPCRKSVLAKGDLGDSYRKGVSQIDDWKIWLDSYFASLHEVFEKVKNPEITLPREFIKYDSTRVHFVVVSGARSEYTEKTYRLRRDKHKKDDVLILHYDNLADSAGAVIGANTY
ncbi:MAG: Shedu anti-phage system protein SduA domain-containing protein [Elusimicrobiales bacterium]